MLFFSSKKKPLPPTILPPTTSRVEVELHKDATIEAKQHAVKANTHLIDILIENGFTYKIFAAAGGQLHGKKGTGVK